MIVFFKMTIPSLLLFFRSFQTIYRINTVDFIGIRTRIVRVQGEYADHFTTTTTTTGLPK